MKSNLCLNSIILYIRLACRTPWRLAALLALIAIIFAVGWLILGPLLPWIIGTAIIIGSIAALSTCIHALRVRLPSQTRRIAIMVGGIALASLLIVTMGLHIAAFCLIASGVITTVCLLRSNKSANRRGGLHGNPSRSSPTIDI